MKSKELEEIFEMIEKIDTKISDDTLIIPMDEYIGLKIRLRKNGK